MDRKEYDRQYYLNNKEKIKQQQKAYRKTPAGKRIATKQNWKQQGLIETEDYTYDSLYDRYLVHTNCDLCDVELTVGRYNTATTKCMDHDHVTRIFRNFVCHSCNTKRR
tara:strand:+ start:50 stop:376 length:327 start_codon:yes stop_codon:yes gene_type:complete